MPMPIARGGRARALVLLRKSMSTIIATTPTPIPKRMKFQSKSELKMPCAMVVMRTACGAASACDGSMVSRGRAPVKP